MNIPTLPLLIEPDNLEQHLNDSNVRIVDLCRTDIYASQHLPGAVHLDYTKIIRNTPPVIGLLPEAKTLAGIFSELGIAPHTHVVAYDEEGGGKAARLLWTLHAMGHTRTSLLNGGLAAWAGEGHRMEAAAAAVAPASYQVNINNSVVADRAYILAQLKNPGVRLLDCRSTREFSGAVRSAERAGHIPGAVNMDWLLAMDQTRNLRFKTPAELRALLEQRDVTPSQEVIVYCHTHHRSAHTYMVLKSLGYERVRGYPGSWSDWGNAADTPVETG